MEASGRASGALCQSPELIASPQVGPRFLHPKDETAAGEISHSFKYFFNAPSHLTSTLHEMQAEKIFLTHCLCATDNDIVPEISKGDQPIFFDAALDPMLKKEELIKKLGVRH